MVLNNWAAEQIGGAGWTVRRPFRDLSGLERGMLRPAKREAVREWLARRWAP